MSGRIVGEILNHAPDTLTPAEFLTLIAIGEDAHDKNRRATYSDLASLTRRTRLKPGTIRNALSSLVARGLIVPQVKAVHRGGNHQEYVVPKLEEHHRHVNGTERP